MEVLAGPWSGTQHLHLKFDFIILPTCLSHHESDFLQGLQNTPLRRLPMTMFPMKEFLEVWEQPEVRGS